MVRKISDGLRGSLDSQSRIQAAGTVLARRDAETRKNTRRPTSPSGSVTARAKPINAAEESFFIQCRIVHQETGLPLPERNYRFHLSRRWEIDFAWPIQKIGIEIDGGIWMKGGGAHSRPANIERDMEKHNAATLSGWKILRVQPQHIHSGEAMELLHRMLDDPKKFPAIGLNETWRGFRKKDKVKRIRV